MIEATAAATISLGFCNYEEQYIVWQKKPQSYWLPPKRLFIYHDSSVFRDFSGKQKIAALRQNRPAQPGQVI